MSETPERCPTCATRVPEGAVRCPACGRVFGEENRCPHCNAVAAVIPRGGITVCAACGKPRTGTVLLGQNRAGSGVVPASHRGRTASTAAMLSRGRGRVQRGFGVMALASGVLMAVLATALVPGAFGIAVALAAALLGVGLGALSIRAGARSMTEGEREERRAREAAVFELAEKRGGRLTASEVARAFGISADDADALLTSLIGDGTRVTVDVDEEGVVRYVFLELVPRPAAQVRVAVDEEEEVAADPGPRAGTRARREEG